jgi:putative chitinase
VKFFLPVDTLRTLWPEAKPEVIQGVSLSSTQAFDQNGISQLVDLQDFMAQISEETGGMTLLTENLHYSAARAHDVWPSLFPTAASAAPYVADPRKFADKVYGGRMGNVPGTDDGYNFRGRGPIQLTGRDLYAAIGKVAGLDLVNNPDLASDPDHALIVAAAYWKYAGVSKIALTGNFEAVTKRVNGGLTNIQARLAWLSKVQKILTLDEVTKIPSPTPAPPPIVVSTAGVPQKVHPGLLAEIEAVLFKWL